jgi:hypothetical protein
VVYSAGFAQTLQDSTKRNFNLFLPTPKNQMRSFETDRPDVTESAYTVNAGHFQYETDLFKTDRSKVDGIKTVQNYFNSFNVKLGLTNSLDIQLVADMLVNMNVTRATTSRNNSSFGNITIRMKQNILGNDVGKMALAILPFINIPTTAKNKITGGLVVPLAVSLPNDWDFGTQIEADFETNQSGKGTHLNYQTSATISHALFSKCDFFTEASISREMELKSWEYFLNGGLVYELKENLKVDSGLYYGLKNRFSKVIFVGLSFRY